jgi:NADH-quinone oxidoreductase subunit L
MAGEQDMRKMGGLKSRLPVTYRTFLIATLALAGIPPLAGFFSKDAILAGVFEHERYVLWGLGLFTAGLTAFYMFRLVSLTFEGGFRGTPEQEHHLHESPASMTVPLVILAALSVVGGWIGLPKVLGENADKFAAFLSPILLPLASTSESAARGLSGGAEWLLMGVSVTAALAGLLIARNWYVRQQGRPAERLAASFPSLSLLVAEKFRVDEFYDVVIVRPFDWLARALWKVVDVLVIDGILNAGAFLVELVGDLLRFLQTGNVRNYALGLFLGLIALMLFVIGAV